MHLIAKIDDSSHGGVMVEIMDNDNQVEKKIIKVKDFVDALTTSVKQNGEFFRVGKMPYGYYDSMFSNLEENSFKCVIIIPKGKQIVQYKDITLSIPFPSLVFYFEVKNGNVTISSCYAIKDEIPNDRSPLYRYPFGNVYKSGSICWGANHLKDISNIKELEYIITLFYCLPTNNDLYSCGTSVAVNDITLNLHGFYTKLQEMSCFPENLLLNADKELGMLLV